MRISVCPAHPHRVDPFETTFALQQDNWNDFGFRTLYHLHYRRVPSDPPTLIGPVGILRRDQDDHDRIQITDPFERLPDDFCSVGRSLDYYERLNEIDAGDRDAILSALRDVVHAPSLQADFSSEEGWRTSLFRDESNIESYLLDATTILSGNFTALGDVDVRFSFHPAGWSEPIDFDFTASDSSSVFHLDLPHRIVVLIGRNGCGKSTLLSRLARVAFAPTFERGTPELQALGKLQPDIGFTRIVAVSYSAFDNFPVPGLGNRERRQVAIDMDQGVGRYVYAGLRDISADYRRDDHIPTEPLEHDPAALAPDADDGSERLKTLTTLADEFGRMVAKVRAAGDEELLERCLRPVLHDPSFADIDGGSFADLFGAAPERAFKRWSTGHKIALHVLTALVAHVDRKSLVLFDEPEMHLHPPLVAALMHAVRAVLAAKHATAIVATHSSVVLQETFAKHVLVVRRHADAFHVVKPDLETFGENVGSLTSETFGLTADSATFYQTLDSLVTAHTDIDQIDELFNPGLSGQARAYVMAAFARKQRR